MLRMLSQVHSRKNRQFPTLWDGLMVLRTDSKVDSETPESNGVVLRTMVLFKL